MSYTNLEYATIGGKTTTRTSVAYGSLSSSYSALAINVDRVGATIYNNTNDDLYIGLGTTAVSTSDFTVKVVADAYYELPYKYHGAVRIIAAGASSGNVQITDISKI